MDILRDLRERAGLTVIRAAEQIGVTRAAIYSWESGAKWPDQEPLRKAMDVYGASEAERAEVAKLRAFGPSDSSAAPPG